MDDIAGLVIGRRLDVLASNRLARALFTDFDGLPYRDRNMARWVFLSDTARSLYADWEAAARGTVAALRLYAGSHPRNPQLASLVGELSLRDEDFRHWWADDHDVVLHTHGPKQLHRPMVGDLTVDYEALTVNSDPDQQLALHTAEPDSPSSEALGLLASWAAPSRPSR